MKKLINNIVLRAITACILFCLPTVNLFAQNPCSASKYSATNCYAARSAFKSASVIVTGSVGDSKLREWIEAASKLTEWQTNLNDGFKFTDAVTFLKQRLAQDKGVGLYGDGASDRAMTIDNAFKQVYGRSSTPLEQASWEVEIKAQKAWYATIVTGELNKISTDPTLRIPIIQRAYMDAMGRMPYPDDLNYWKAQKEPYPVILEACRTWLYSAAGTKDLLVTVTRALKNKYKNATPSDEVIKDALRKYTDKLAIYSEM